MKVLVSTMPSSVTVLPNSAMMMNPNICSTQLTLKLATTLVLGDIVQFSVTTPSSVEIGDDGALKFEGSDELFAAVSINDPYHYSDKDFAIIVKGKNHAIPIKLVAKSLDGLLK